MKKKIKQEEKIERRILKQIEMNKEHIVGYMKIIRRRLRDMKKALEEGDMASMLDINTEAVGIMLDAEAIAELASEMWVLKRTLDDKFWEEDEEKNNR